MSTDAQKVALPQRVVLAWKLLGKAVVCARTPNDGRENAF